MKMVVPDYWQGKGRYSKQALSRKIKDETPFAPLEPRVEDPAKK